MAVDNFSSGTVVDSHDSANRVFTAMHLEDFSSTDRVTSHVDTEQIGNGVLLSLKPSASKRPFRECGSSEDSLPASKIQRVSDPSTPTRGTSVHLDIDDVVEREQAPGLGVLSPASHASSSASSIASTGYTPINAPASQPQDPNPSRQYDILPPKLQRVEESGQHRDGVSVSHIAQARPCSYTGIDGLPITISIIVNPSQQAAACNVTTIDVTRSGVQVMPTIVSRPTPLDDTILQDGFRSFNTSEITQQIIVNVAERLARKIETYTESDCESNIHYMRGPEAQMSKKERRGSAFHAASTFPRQLVHPPSATTRNKAPGSKVKGTGKGSKTQKLLAGYPPPSASLPDHATLVDICQDWPNHLIGENLIPFIQYGWSSRDILAAVKQPLNKDDMRLNKSMLNSRLRKTRNDLGERYEDIMKQPPTRSVGQARVTSLPDDETTESADVNTNPLSGASRFQESFPSVQKDMATDNTTAYDRHPHQHQDLDTDDEDLSSGSADV